MTFLARVLETSGMRFLKYLILLGLPLGLQAQEGAASDRHPLFQDEAVLKAVLTAPISQAYAQRHQEARIYFPGQWTYIDEHGETQRLEVKIRTRGHFRREVCEQPPLQLNFKKSQVKGTLFAGQNKLKLVAPCKEGKRYQQYVILEYLAYKIYQLLTDESFTPAGPGSRERRVGPVQPARSPARSAPAVIPVPDRQQRLLRHQTERGRRLLPQHAVAGHRG
jgi:hypothetical protein